MIEGAGPEVALLLRQTAVVKPQLEQASSRQSVAADEEEYQSSASSSSSAPSRPASAASNAALLDDNLKYTTPPTSPPRLAADPVPHANQPVQPVMAQPRGAAQGASQSTNVRFDERQIRRKPVVGGSSSSSSGSPQRTNYPPPRTSVNRSPPSPSADDTPYIRFALDQLTRDEEVRGSRRYPTNDRWSTAPPYVATAPLLSQDTRVVSPTGNYPIPRPYPSRQSRQPIPSQRVADAPSYEPLPQSIHNIPASDPRSATAPTSGLPDDAGYHTPPQEPTTTYRITPVQSRTTLPAMITQPDVFVPYDSEVPSLRFLPGILRPFWLSIFIFLCLLMLVAVAFSAIWSSKHSGLFQYTTFGGSRYFLFQYLPLMCGMFLLLWLFQVQIAVQRVAPFIALASEDTRCRTEAPLMELQPTNFLLPKVFYFRAGLPIVGFSMIVFWLQIFTIPLLASVYNVAYYINHPALGWRWQTVQGIAWTLFALYLLLVVALVLLGVWLWRQRTGLKWDPRSLADTIALLDRFNVTRDYEGSETFTSVRDFRSRLAMRSDRLGYWSTSHRPNEVFYGIGEEGANTRRYSLEAGRLREKDPAEGTSGFYPDTPTTPGAPVFDLEDGDEFDQIRYRYIPWYLRTAFVLLWIIAAFILYIAFLAVSYVNNAIIHGFSPLLEVRANAAGFSSTNFVYSFIPAVISQIIFLCWLSVDYAFRRLQPYAAMSNYQNSGASASDALLLDYPFRLPFSVTITALLSKDLRVAWFSFLSLIAACIPILAGGCFWAQWYTPSQEVRVAVNPSAYYALCTFLAIFTFSLPLMIFGLHQRRLPHSCSTLADQISFLYASQILGEREWRAPLGSKTEMTTRLLTAATSQERAMQGGRFLFGRFVGKDGRTHLGIERVGRNGGKGNWRTRDTSGLLTQPPPVAKSGPRLPRTAGGTVVASGTRVNEGEGFPTLPVAGAAVAGVGAAGAAGYAYDYGSKQDLLRESDKAEYVRRKEGGTFGSPTLPETTTAATVPSVAPRLVTPVSPVNEDADYEAENERDVTTAAAPRAYDYGSKQDLLAESDKAAYVRLREGGGFGSNPTSSVYPSGTTVSPDADVATPVGAGAAAAAAAGASTTAYPSGTSTTRAVGYPSGSSAYPTPVPPTQEGPGHARMDSSTLPATPAVGTGVYSYGSAYGSMRDLSPSNQAEYVRQREGGMLAQGATTNDASRGAAPAGSPVVSSEGLDVGQDLPSMLRDAAAGRWSFE